MNRQQICRIEECAKKVLQLCDGEPLPPFQVSGTGRWWEEVEQETSKARAFLEAIPGRLKELLSTHQKKARYEEAQKQIDDDCGDYTKWEIKRDPYSLKDQQDAENVFRTEMPRYARWAWEYYDWSPLEPGTKITEPLNRREKALAAYFGIKRIVNVVSPPDPDEKFNRDREQFQRDFKGDDDAGVFRVEEGYAERLKVKYEEALGIIGVDLKQSEQEAISGSDMSGPKAQAKVPMSEPSREATQAYKFYYGSGKTQEAVAKIMARELNKPVSQGQVSRWVNEYKLWARANDIPIAESEKPKTINMDHRKLDMRARTDGRTTGDPRHKAKFDTDE